MASSAVVMNGLVFVFGGCCANVLTLEDLIKENNSNVGILVTFTQFLFITLTLLPGFVSFESGMVRLKPLNVPLKVYIWSVILFYTSSSTNNSVFKYKISIPLHIVFRCFSTVITMIVSWLVNKKRYSRLQVIAACLLTIGAIITSLYQDHEFSLEPILSWWKTRQDISMKTNSEYDTTFLLGICLLVISSISSALLSVYNEWTYKTYGKHWQENLFYTHFLSLPIFMIKDGNHIMTGYRQLTRSGSKVGRSHVLLFSNIITQNICIRGVNILASHTNALTLSVILTVRKFVSLLLSVVIYKNILSYTSYVGVATVFFGTLLYILGSRQSPQVTSQTKKNQ
ncbi:similar to Saccharomyces cerevisiae YEL004W YEA4 Uridine diphosphate-N-acetylglucosamine (UDP-GlcNAc) transporter required for cell wall chitin synthesis [Maudiozyma saulgeensis]|uniref:Similar to Saccharomyces cerevisiae YEL004W YEA4 Uridine diphosphate-N-acetylglucosamine (UDP-GlcNAc) transporter required for cell wall chitin synthesis n=1 Tax=Maudiozyma saulgeensis TaxID=1789683 RepID=A0A1X7R2W2_9SACH|nr:similar to Saccharomyces cerevisiae YEL004W YEA4 Uridine diphosphate-N-acetylglucosamine (UDP-GlcNAc) transporter required for cell wall chitin synthesis [Kazachstania saulgeensis]